METKNTCAIDNALNYLGKRWALQIIRDLFQGRTRFNEFLKKNKELSGKVLSERLKDLENNDIITKTIVEKNPVLIEYHLTSKGKELDKVIAELANFAHKHCAPKGMPECNCKSIEEMKSLNKE